MKNLHVCNITKECGRIRMKGGLQIIREPLKIKLDVPFGALLRKKLEFFNVLIMKILIFKGAHNIYVALYPVIFLQVNNLIFLSCIYNKDMLERDPGINKLRSFRLNEFK